MGRVDLHAVPSGGLHPLGRLAELADDDLQLLAGHRPGGLLGVVGSHVGGRDELGRAGDGEGHIGRVKQLGQDFRSVLVDGGGELLPAGDKGVVVDGHIAGQIDIRGLHGGHFGDDEPHAALGTGGIVGHQRVGDIALVRKIGGQRRHEHPVFHRGLADLDGGEQVRVGHIGQLLFTKNSLSAKASDFLTISG